MFKFPLRPASAPTDFHLIPEREHLRRLLPHLGIDCVFDVGANAGQYATMLRKEVGYRGRIISFEPIPRLAAEVRALAARDPLWTIEEVALDEADGTAVFNVMAADQFSTLGTPKHDEVALFKTMNVTQERIEVRKESLATAFARLKAQYGFSRPFLKMDTQGFDVRIALGGRSVIANFLGLQSELAIKRLYEESVDFREAITAYESLGFELSALVPNNAGHFPTLVEIDCIMTRRTAEFSRP
jgi:FkbM family methyltransferase